MPFIFRMIAGIRKILTIEGIMVKDFIVSDHIWNQAALAQTLSKELVDQILYVLILMVNFKIDWVRVHPLD